MLNRWLKNMAFTQPERVTETLILKDEAGLLAVSPPKVHNTLTIAKKTNSLWDLWDERIVYQLTSSASKNAQVEAEINQHLLPPCSSREAADLMT
jgi:hypothetical protein